MKKQTIKTIVSNRRAGNNTKRSEKGSVLVLTLIAVLILSITVTGLLLVGRTELFSTQSNYLDKAAYYTAVWGVEEIRQEILNGETLTIGSMIKTYPTTQFVQDSIDRMYIIGSMKDMEDTVYAIEGGGTMPQKTLEEYAGVTFTQAGASLSVGSGTKSMVWKVHVTGKASGGKRHAFAEIIAGVASTLKTTSQ